MQKEKKVRQIVFPFNSDAFMQTWDIWKEYKKEEWSFKYKSEISEQGALNHLTVVSHGVELVAIQIIHQSIANGWKGFFQLKNDINGGKVNQSKPAGGKASSESINQAFNEFYKS